MKQIQRYKLENGGHVDIEVNTVSQRKGTGAVSTGLSSKIRETKTELRDLLKTIPDIANDIHHTLKSAIESADELSLEFGCKIGADMSIIVSKSSAEAHFKVNIKWKD